MLVAGAVVAHGGLGHGLLALGEGDRHGRPAGRRPAATASSGHAGGGLEGGQRPAGVAAGDPHEVVAGVVVERVRRRRARARRRRAAVEHVGDLVVGERLQGDRASSGESSGAMTQNDGFSVVAATRTTCRFSTPGQQGVLLGLGEPVDLVEEEHGLAAVQVAVAAGLLHDRADVLDPGRDRRQLDELGGRRRWRRGGPGWSCRCRAAPRGSPRSGRPLPRLPSISRRSGLPGRSTSPWPAHLVELRGRIRTASGGSDAPPPRRHPPTRPRRTGRCRRGSRWRGYPAADRPSAVLGRSLPLRQARSPSPSNVGDDLPSRRRSSPTFRRRWRPQK